MKLIQQKFAYYQKLHIATLIEKKYRRGEFVGQSRQYYEALSSILGRCGHRHRSAEAAEPCLSEMKRLMKLRRRSESMEKRR
jgi:hypothetical protein